MDLPESQKVNKFITTYPVKALNEIGMVKCTDDKVYVNADQYFDRVPKAAWKFYIGGYHPARIETDGAGETKPVAPNDSPVNKALNRRVELIKL